MAEGPSTEPILSDDSNSPDVKAFRKLVCENFSSLFGNNQFTDLRIIVDNKTIKVHKICLICHSPVFKTMLSTDWEESSTNEIRINDFNYETVMQMIEFMYTSKASKLAEMPESILEISQKYGIGILKNKCQKVLIPTICDSNVLRLLILADRNGADDLEKAALKYLKTHYKLVRLTDMWKEVRQTHAHIFEKIADYGYDFVSPKKPRRF